MDNAHLSRTFATALQQESPELNGCTVEIAYDGLQFEVDLTGETDENNRTTK
jgi:hypothetical protein